jgi:hypothetical protein
VSSSIGKLAACGALLLGAAFTILHASCASLAGVASDPCSPSSPPPRPAVVGGGGPDLVVAIQNLHFAVDYGSDAREGSVTGLDLDHACSKEDGTPTSCVGSSLGMPPKDDSNGVDNVLGWLLLVNYGQIRTFLSQSTDPRITLILVLKDFNGKAEDDQVEVDAFVTAGVEDDAGRAAEPQWDGGDRWTVSCETLPLCNPQTLVTTASDLNAYVTGGKLVSQGLSSLPVVTTSQLSEGGPFVAVLVNLSDPVIVAPLVNESGGGIGIRGALLGGRWATVDMIKAVSTVCVAPDASTQFLCPIADLTTPAKRDGTGQACDAISVGMRFDGHPAILANHIVPIVYNGLCDAATGACP